MTTGGWIIMLVSVATVTTLFAWCLLKVLRNPSGTAPVGELDSEEPEREPPNAG